MLSTKYIGMDVHRESVSIAVMNSAGKLVMECVIETKASTILQFVDGLHGDLQGSEATKTPAAGDVFFLDFRLYRTSQDLTHKKQCIVAEQQADYSLRP